MSIDFGKGKWTKVDWAKNLTTIGIPLILFLIPCSGIYDMQMKLFFVSTVMAVLCFAFEMFLRQLLRLHYRYFGYFLA